MRELFFPGVRVYLKEKANVHRKTNYDLVLVEHRDILVSVDSRVPNLVIGEAIENNMIPELDGLHYVKSEPTYRDSRFDLLLSKGSTRLFLEVKGCTLVVEEEYTSPIS